MNKTVNAEETVAPEQGLALPANCSLTPEVHRSVIVPKGAGNYLGYFASCSASPARAIWLQSATWMRGTGPQTKPGVPSSTTRFINGDHLQPNGHLSDQLNHHTR